MESKKKYKLQEEFDIEVNQGDVEYSAHDEDQVYAAKELVKFQYGNEELIRKHVLMILAEDLDYFTAEDKETYDYDVLPIVKEGISDIAWNRLNLSVGEASIPIFDELDRMVDIRVDIDPESFRLSS